jgi:hypothetical protein
MPFFGAVLKTSQGDFMWVMMMMMMMMMMMIHARWRAGLWSRQRLTFHNLWCVAEILLNTWIGKPVIASNDMLVFANLTNTSDGRSSTRLPPS